MKTYEILTPLAIEPGKPPRTGAIELADDEAQSLIACGAIRPVPDLDVMSGDDLAQVDALASLTVADLIALAKEEGVSDVPEKAKKDVLIAAIQAHRATVPAESAAN